MSEFIPTTSTVEEFLLKEGVSKAYGLYAMSVIKGRALPDIKDGLKPVQRRILFSMYESGFRYNKPFKKCARIVGDVLGKYHPHGESSVYEALVNMAQDFGASLPLIQGQGNFGSIDGDRAASVRYTEARLQQVSEYLLQDYEKDTVPLRYNYDESCQMPVVLPAQFPNLLVNGTSGIAVGMATSIPPHNLGEVLDALIAMLDKPNMELAEIMEYIKGPDFPMGGEFYGGSTLLGGYTTGRGKVILQGTCFEEEMKGKVAIIINAIPYQIIKPRLIERITQLITEGPLEDIADIRDESGKDIRVVLELKRDSNVEIIKQRLFALTQMRVSVSLNMVAIHDQKPGTFGLVEILNIFLQFREEVVQKRAEYILNKTSNRAHIIWGLALATNMMDEVIKTIRSSEDAKDAEEKLMQIQWKRDQYDPIIKILDSEYQINEPYYFSKEQAKGILELRLQKLTKLECNELLDDLRELGLIIEEQRKIIENRAYRFELMKAEFAQLREKFAVPRRTKVLAKLDDMHEESLIEREDIVVMLTANGYIKRINLEEYKVQNRGGKGKIGHKKSEDPILNLFMTNTLAPILFFTSKGKVFSMKAYEIPEGSSTSRGRAAVNLFKLDENEKITTILPVDMIAPESAEPKIELSTTASEEIIPSETTPDVGSFLIFVTEKGTIRRNDIEDFTNIRANGKIAMKLDEGNYLHSVLLVEEKDELLLTSSYGNSIRFAVGDIRVFESRSSVGVRAMNLQNDDHIIGATVIKNGINKEILCITENGYGKRSNLNEYRRIKRGGKGSKSMNINAKTGKIVEAIAVDATDELLLMTKQGQTIRTKVADIRKTGRVTSGVIVMKLPKGDLITQAMRIEMSQSED